MHNDNAEEQFNEIRSQAFRLLARREYSYKELQQRFERSHSHGDVMRVLDYLVEEGYQSDRRFCEIYVRNRLSQGHGLSRIRFDVRQKGIDDSLLSEVLEQESPDWYELALEVRLRRFPEIDRSDRKLVAKVMRFMLQRGFSSEEARCAVEYSED